MLATHRPTLLTHRDRHKPRCFEGSSSFIGSSESVVLRSRLANIPKRNENENEDES
jgi:hypothetical protein